MKSKKLLSIFITAAVTLGTTSTVFASPIQDKLKVMEAAGEIKGADTAQEQKAKITKDAAKEIGKTKLKEYMGYELDETKFESRIEYRPFYYNENDDYVWDMNWNSNDAIKSVNINVSVNANNGKIVSMGKREYSRTNSQPSIPSITQEQAKEAAEAFIKKVNPEKLDETRLIDDSMNRYMYGGYQPVNYNFNYQRYVNGVLLEGDFIRIEVDGVTGNVISFETRWGDGLKLPAAEGIIDKAKAEEIFRKQAEMSLMYINFRNKYDYEFQSKAIKLVYNLGYESSGMVDAKTGTILDYAALSGQKMDIKDLTPEQKAALLKKVGEVKSAASEIDSSRAEKVMTEKLKEIFGEDYKVDYLRYEENSYNYDTNGRKAWTASFYKDEESRRLGESGQITIDALTEGIINLYRFDNSFRYDEEFTSKLTWEEAYNVAVEAVAKYFPDKLNNIKTELRHIAYKQIINGKEIPEREYYFHFPRLANGIVYNNDNVSVSIDAKTGTFRQLACRWTDKLEFPSTTGAMKASDAEDILFEKFKPELTYVLIPNSKVQGKSSGEYKLVYRLKSSVSPYMTENIDAFTGKLVNYDGQEVSEQSDEFQNKIKGHKAEKELSILAFQGILDTANFELNKEVTKLDFVKMLVDAKGYRPYILKDIAALKYSNVGTDNANYKYLQMAVYYGILENKEGEFDFNQKVTREEMAIALVKLLGYDNLAKAKDIFTLSLSDSSEIKEDSLGYLAIAKALGILEVENEKIRPADNATMVEMSLAIYKVLDNLRSGYYY